MLLKTWKNYQNSFKGLSKEVWFLAIITFVNRAGTMVVPFLSLYLSEDLHFSLSQVGWVMSSFGVGSLVGSYLGGKLIDTVGFYKVMFFSLLTTGILFIALQFIHTFYGFTLAIFLTMSVADMFRPAMFVSLKAYSKSENRTRSLTLVRLAINLGFSFGPFLGGIIIATISYSGLFWVDGLTCIAAVLMMYILLQKKEIQRVAANSAVIIPKSDLPLFKDKPYLIFLFVIFLMGFMFLQLFSTMPLFYKNIHNLSEVQIGLLMSINGFLIFLFEMPLIHYLEKTLIDRLKIITWSLLLFVVSFVLLNVTKWAGILIISMLFITFGEMMAFPFTNNFALNRASEGREGRYLALYTMSFSMAHIFSAKTGMEIIDRFGFSTNWYLIAVFGILAVVLILWLRKELELEKLKTQNISIN